MELILIRHGQAEHNLNVPESLRIAGPTLTPLGIEQIAELRNRLNAFDNDLMIASPTRRTIESLLTFSRNTIVGMFVSPLVGPRMYPQNPEWNLLPCDQLLSKDLIKMEYGNIEFLCDDNDCWTDGINTISDHEFEKQARVFLDWILKNVHGRCLVFSHDGTINHYRELLEGKKLSRKDVLGEAGWFRIFL